MPGDRKEWDQAMGRNATKSQQAKARAREARLAMLADRNAQDERIEDATARALLAWQDVTAARARLGETERETAAALAQLGQEKVPVKDMAVLTGIGEPECGRLLRLAVDSRKSDGDGSADAAE